MLDPECGFDQQFHVLLYGAFLAEQATYDNAQIGNEGCTLLRLGLSRCLYEHAELAQCVLANLFQIVASPHQPVDFLVKPTTPAYFLLFTGPLLVTAGLGAGILGFRAAHDFMNAVKIGGSFWEKKS